MNGDARTGAGDHIAQPGLESVGAKLMLGELRASMFGRREPVRVGRFDLRQRLGHGTFGVVYLADDAQLQRRVAVKLLNAESEPSARARFLREAQALARLKHPNVLTIHDVGVEDDRVFIAMEYVEAGTLAAWCRAHPPGTRARFREVLALAIGTARGLAAAHAAGIVHRDVKPANILVGGDGRPRVADFGLARAAEAAGRDADPLETRDVESSSQSATLTRTGETAGTPAYMAPEHFAGQCDAASDQWSFCASFWEAAYGERPYHGRDVDTLREAVCAPPRAPPAARAEVPVWWRDALARGLDPDPRKRWPSVAALATVLERATARRRARTIAFGGGSLALAGLLGLGGWQIQQDHRRARCRAEAETIDGIWNPETRTRLQEAFVATEVSFAERTLELAMPLVDAYAEAWTTRYGDLCVAKVDGERTPELWAASRRCLEERKGELAVLLDVLAEKPSPVTIARSVTAVATLGRIEPCADDLWLARQGGDDDAAGAMRSRLWKAHALDSAGRYAEGAELARTLADELADHPGARLRSESRLLAGRLTTHVGEFEAAHDLLTKAFDDALGAGEHEIALESTISLVFVTGVEMARYDEALVWGRVASALYHQLGDTYDLHAARLYNALGGVAWAQGRHAEAERHYERAFSTMAQVMGEDHPELAMVRNNLATVYHHAGRFEEAVRAHSQTLAIRERVLGEEHPDTAQSHFGLANALWGQKRFEESEQAFERALALQVRALGAHHPDTAKTRGGLANVYAMQKRYDDAARTILDMREDLLTSLGPNHPTVAQATENLGAVYAQQRRFPEAEAELTHALAIAEKAYAPDHPHLARILHNLARVYTLTGRHREAEGAYTRRLAVLEQQEVQDRSEILDALVGMVDAQLEQDLDTEAVTNAERAVAIAESLEGDVVRTAGARFGLARALVAAGREHRRAVELAELARQAYEAAGAEHAAALGEVEAFLAR